MLEKNIDTVVLGCTHYPFVIPLIREIVGSKVNVIDPTNAIVRQVSRILDNNNLSNKEEGVVGKISIFTSGEINSMNQILLKLFDDSINVKKIDWINNLELNVLE